MIIQADSQQLFQVLLNIFLNAMQASFNNTTITVTTQVRENDASFDAFGGSVILVSIADHGSGIKKKDLTSIFQPFFTTKSEGTGLGLATCKRIVDAHKGDIYVETEIGEGTKMTVVLPTKLTQDVLVNSSARSN